MPARQHKDDAAPRSTSARPGATSSHPAPEVRPRSSREETTTRILDVAEELFSKRDPSKVTVREIAEKAGVTHPLVHQYIGSKSDILDAVIKRGAPARHEIISAHPDYREAMPLLFADVLSQRVHTRSIVRSAMDGVEYAPFEDRVKTGQMLLELATQAVARGTVRAPVVSGAMDPRVALAASVALAYGWVATQDWLLQIFDLQAEDPETLNQQLEDVLMYVAELVFPPADSC
jgi:AcrR family transcriptional regulator